MGRGIGYVGSLAMHPPFSFRLAEKKTGRTRRGYTASVSGTAANGCAMDGPKEKTLGANLHMRASLLQYGGLPNVCRLRSGIFCRLAPDSPLAGGWLPRVGAWSRTRWWFRILAPSLSAGATLVL